MENEARLAAINAKTLKLTTAILAFNEACIIASSL